MAEILAPDSAKWTGPGKPYPLGPTICQSGGRYESLFRTYDTARLRSSPHCAPPAKSTL